VVTSPQQRARLHDVIVPHISAPGGGKTPGNDIDPVQRRVFEGAAHLLTTLRDTPVLLFVCASSLIPGDPKEDRYQFAAIYGATQNMLVAGRALGLGIAPTGLHNFNTKAVREVLNVPENKIIAVTMAVGWPARPFRPVKRKPTTQVIHVNSW